MEYEITDAIKECFLNALEEVVVFVKPDESDSTDLDPGFKNELHIHGTSFLYRAWCFFIAENKQRLEDNVAPKTVDALAHDFFFTACGDGVGFWEEGPADWMHCGKVLENTANHYFYHGYSVMESDDGLLIGG